MLTNFVVSKDSGSRINELGKLSHLRSTLTISKLEFVVNAIDASKADLKSKNYLNELVFQWNSDTHEVQTETKVLEKLSNGTLRPQEDLKKLTIENYGGARFPNWLGDAIFANMVFLCLSRCKKCMALPPLGQLSSLQELRISKMERLQNLDAGFYGNSHMGVKPFRCLKTLWFEDLPNWVQLDTFYK